MAPQAPFKDAIGLMLYFKRLWSWVILAGVCRFPHRFANRHDRAQYPAQSPIYALSLLAQP
ncbi:MAG: hypothetical protein F6K32_08060 [Desertifilum sp. SIO1I2]|nr:hypothetical protein [Desertifilum sp. SIO1I2]